MVWEYKCASIVMLTKEREGPRVRCHRYWPDGTDMYGQTQVVLLTENQYAGYIQREFKLIDTKVGGRGNLFLLASPGPLCCYYCTIYPLRLCNSNNEKVGAGGRD